VVPAAVPSGLRPHDPVRRHRLPVLRQGPPPAAASYWRAARDYL